MFQLKTIKTGSFAGEKIEIQDLCTNVFGCSWMFNKGNPVCIEYAIRSARDNLPTDDKVYYGKINGMGYLVHESEI